MPNVVIGIVAVLLIVWAIIVMMLPLSFSQEYQAQPPPKLLDSASYYKDDSSFGTGENQLIVSGHIMNNFSAPIGSVSVSATYYDGSGNMVGQSSGVTPEFILYPGQRSSFEIATSGGAGGLVVPAQAVRYISLYVSPPSFFNWTEVQLFCQYPRQDFPCIPG